MTQRLPVVGSDDNTWGTVLNGFLGVAHNSDGSLSTSAVSSSGAEMTSNKGTANGYAPLDGSSLLPYANIPVGAAGTASKVLALAINDNPLRPYYRPIRGGWAALRL